MSELNTAPSEQPAPTITPVETPGAQPQSENHSEAIGTLDQSTLGDVLWGEKKEPSEPAEASPAAPVAETTPPNPETGAQPTEGASTNEAKDNESSLRRLALGGVPMSERQQLAEVTRMIREGEATSQVDALRKMGLLDAPAPTATETPASHEPHADSVIADPVTDIESAIADLREQRKNAKADFDTTEEERLTNLIEDQMVSLAEARADARIAAASQQTQVRSYQHEYVTTVDAMEEKFPWATDETDPRYQALDDKVTAARARNDATLQDPKFIMSFAEKIDQQFGKPQPPAKPPAPPPTPSRIVGGGVAPGHSEAHVPTEIEARQLVNTSSKEQLAAALFR